MVALVRFAILATWAFNLAMVMADALIPAAIAMKHTKTAAWWRFKAIVTIRHVGILHAAPAAPDDRL